MAVALYWARAFGTEWETGKRTGHSQRTAAIFLGLNRNTVMAAIDFWRRRGFMKTSRQMNGPLLIDLVLPAQGDGPPPPRRADYPDQESFIEAQLRHLEAWKRSAA
jgi:hypothetical protein